MTAVANGNGDLRQRNVAKQNGNGNGNGVGNGAALITEEGRKRDQELDKHHG